MTPPISVVLAVAICWDDYTSVPADETDLWAGAGPHAREGAWQDIASGQIWWFCHDPETGRIEAQDGDGGAYFGFSTPLYIHDGWTKI